MHCTDLNYDRCGMIVLTRCAHSARRNALRKVWKLPYASHRDLVPLIAECVPIDVALVFRFMKFYRTVSLSDNMIVNYIANTMTFAYRSTMGQNVRHIMSKYNMTHHELLYTPMSAIKHKCKEMWNSNVNAIHTMTMQT